MKILFVCNGNICRSPAAQYLLQKMVDENQLPEIQVESAGILKRTDGRHIHPKIAHRLKLFGCDATNHRAEFIGKKKLASYTYILAMDQEILYELTVNYASEYTDKIHLFTSISEEEQLRDIEDPIDTGKYLLTVRRINRLCKQWMNYFEQLEI